MSPLVAWATGQRIDGTTITKEARMQLIARKSPHSLRHAALALMLVLVIGAPAVHAAGQLRPDQPASEILTGLQKIQADAKAGKRGWDNISVEKKGELTSMQERVVALLEGKRSAADLQLAERVDLTTTLDKINTLAKEADDQRQVCIRERVVGSNFPINNCSTVAERRRLREASQNSMLQQNTR
jgi:hypothetical protein